MERKKAEAVFGALALTVLLGCAICGGPAAPPTDTCSSPQTGKVTSVELATPRLDSRRFADDAALNDRPPRLLGDGDPLWEVRGGQGASMVPVRLVFRGSEVPSCLAQDTRVTVGGQLAARNRDNVATYPLEAGARATKTFWLPGAFERDATLATESAGLKPSVAVRIASMDGCGSLNACPCAEALECTMCDTGLSDAGAQLWRALRDCVAACDAGAQCEAEGGPCGAAARACADDMF